MNRTDMPLADAMRYCELEYHRELYAKLALYVYIQKRDAPPPLHIQYDGSEQHREALLSCILNALPLSIRRVLRWQDANSVGKNADLIFTSDIGEYSRYLIPETGQTDLLEPPIYPLFVTYAAGNLPPKSFDSFFSGMDDLSRQFSDKSDEYSLSLAYACWNPHMKCFANPDVKAMKEQNLIMFLVNAVSCGGTSPQLSHLVSLVREESSRRGLLFSKALQEQLDKNFPVNTPIVPIVSVSQPLEVPVPKSTSQSWTTPTIATTIPKPEPLPPVDTPKPSKESAPENTPQQRAVSATVSIQQPKLTPAAISTPSVVATTTHTASNAEESSINAKEIAQRVISGTQIDAMRVLFETYDAKPILYQTILREMKQSQLGIEYLNRFYFILMRQEQLYSWERFERIINELPESNRKAEIARSLYANIWKFYSNEISAYKNPRAVFDAFCKLVKRMYPTPENLLNEAKELYWRTVSWDNFDADKLDEYHAFLIEGESNEYYALAQLAKEYYPGGEEEYLRKVFLYFDYSTPEGQKFALAKVATANARERIIAKLDNILRVKHGNAVPIYFRKWMSMVSYVDKGSNCLPLIQALYAAMSDYNPKKLYQVYSDFYYKRNVDYVWSLVGHPATELLRITCEKNDSPQTPVPLDLWLWIAEDERKRNLFEIFNSHPDAAVLSMNPKEVVTGSQELKNQLILKMAVEYFIAKSTPKKIRNAVKAWVKAAQH